MVRGRGRGGWPRGAAPWVLLAVLLFVAGCGEQEAKQEAGRQAGTAGQPGGATAQEQQAVESGAQSIQQALELKDRADTGALRSAIRQYRAAQGRYPESLEALPEAREQGLDPSRWTYDPKTGEVRLNPRDHREEAKKQAERASKTSFVESVQRALAARDMADWKAMQVAINLYRAEQGRPPERLEDLPVVQERNIDTSRWVYEPGTGKVYYNTDGR